MDLKEKIYKIMTDSPLAVLATITQDGRPWARYIIITGEKDLRIKFPSSVNSRKVIQINRNPEVHVTCGATAMASMTPYLQIEGKAKITRDENILKQIWMDELKNYFTGPGDPNYCVGIIEPYRIEYVNMSQTTEVWESAKK
jgi:general stress protein 26